VAITVAGGEKLGITLLDRIENLWMTATLIFQTGVSQGPQFTFLPHNLGFSVPEFDGRPSNP
jgi:hypothetical protein